MKLCFASHNKNKVAEIRGKFSEKFEILSLHELNCTEIAETGTTLEENSKIKARYVYENYGISCFADDTGLEVEVLRGAPGVYSARFAGEPSSSERNIDLLLQKMKGQKNRKAAFRTVLTLILEGEIHQFEGKVSGAILSERRGKGGFGYDPVFLPRGYEKSFAEFSIEEKNKISHRGLAIQRLVEFLEEKNKVLV